MDAERAEQRTPTLPPDAAGRNSEPPTATPKSGDCGWRHLGELVLREARARLIQRSSVASAREVQS